MPEPGHLNPVGRRSGAKPFQTCVVRLILDRKCKRALKKVGQFRGAVLDLLAGAHVDAGKEFNLYLQDFSRQLVTPHSGNLPIDQDHGRDPSLVAIDALIELRFQEVLFEAMRQQIDIEIGKQMNRGHLRRRGLQNFHVLTQEQ